MRLRLRLPLARSMEASWTRGLTKWLRKKRQQSPKILEKMFQTKMVPIHTHTSAHTQILIHIYRVMAAGTCQNVSRNGDQQLWPRLYVCVCVCARVYVPEVANALLATSKPRKVFIRAAGKRKIAQQEVANQKLIHVKNLWRVLRARAARHWWCLRPLSPLLPLTHYTFPETRTSQ